MKLDELVARITNVCGDKTPIMSWVDHFDGSQEGIALLDGYVMASWKATLVAAPVFDGVTPRGPKNYHSLEIFTQCTN